MFDEHLLYLRNGLRRLGIVLEDEEAFLGRLLIYLAELKKWNRKINLIARGTEDHSILENHFLDSLTLLPYVKPNLDRFGANLLDVGSGAGFPGLVLKIACRDLAVTLVEPRQKRAFFLKNMIRLLNLSRIEVVQEHLADGPDRPRDKGALMNRRFHFITSRGLTDTKSFLNMVRPYLEPDGRVLCMKGPAEEAELSAYETTVHEMRLLERHSLRLPFSGAERTVLIFGLSPETNE